MVFLKDDGKTVHCSGSLLHPEYVITAGHCFVDKEGDYPANPSIDEVIAGFGVDDINKIDLTFLPIQKKKIKKVHFHKQYRYPHAYNDIAIVELNDPVKITETVYPICIPDSPNSNPDSMEGDFVTLVGYGPDTDSNKTLINKLNQRIFPQRRCAAIFDAERTSTFQLSLKIKTTLPDAFRDGLICAGDSSHKGTCPGDSGAPLMIEEFVDFVSGEKIFKVVAILHGGIEPCDNSVYPALYNRVASPENYEWILNFIQGNLL